jgi:hypothetical protein
MTAPPPHDITKAIRKAIKSCCPSLVKKVRSWIDNRNERIHWEDRIKDVLECPDNVLLQRVSNAGTVTNGWQVMHNGIEVLVDGYYGNGITRMLTANRGCHEPQEEVVFDAIVNSLPPGAIMVEAGAYWAFYSMWLLKLDPEARVFLIEPEDKNLNIGKRNFEHNSCKGNFTHAYVGAAPGTSDSGVPIVAMDSFATDHGLAHIHLLHADVQGFEIELLYGAESLLSSKRIDYLFISTHSPELHRQSSDRLRLLGYDILVSVDLHETHSVDGVLVACSPTVTPPSFPHPSKKNQTINSFA